MIGCLTKRLVVDSGEGGVGQSVVYIHVLYTPFHFQTLLLMPELRSSPGQLYHRRLRQNIPQVHNPGSPCSKDRAGSSAFTGPETKPWRTTYSDGARTSRTITNNAPDFEKRRVATSRHQCALNIPLAGSAISPAPVLASKLCRIATLCLLLGRVRSENLQEGETETHMSIVSPRRLLMEKEGNGGGGRLYIEL